MCCWFATPVELLLIGVCCSRSADGSDSYAEVCLTAGLGSVVSRLVGKTDSFLCGLRGFDSSRSGDLFDTNPCNMRAMP
ncbi:hypothetical protein L1987_35357 [Smallanthus sonchifolius]|uniref:Uncharacterized protein n=1 Tax=Smallanthus sonchifolius TaxID=185202 RepID=A0ACB9HXT9_9ASTR|nr:hypothetical protein L1987_35357 [Smallanthus sonchifolius]